MKRMLLSSRRALLAAASVALSTGISAGAQGQTSSVGAALAKVSPSLSLAEDLGRVDASTPLTLTMHLVADQAGLDKAVADLYDRSSPNFHKWLTDADLKRYAPTDAQVSKLQKEFENQGLTVLSVGPDNMSVRVRGAASHVESAFGTQLHQFKRNGTTFRANVTQVQLRGEAGYLVSSVAGLEGRTVHPTLKRANNLVTGQPLPSIAVSDVAAAGGLGVVLTDLALLPSTTYTLGTPGSLPVATITGAQYNRNYTLGAGKNYVSFLPAQLQQVYGLVAAYKQKLTGKGQTIVLLEAFGYPQMQSDANAFFTLTGLPLLTGDNFSVVYPEGVPTDPNAGVKSGWNEEIALDIQWAHAIAPDAKIVVVLTNGQDNEDMQYSMHYIINHKLGYAVSDSWEADVDLVSGPLEQQSYEDLLKLAAAKGISFQFSTGDSGDNGLNTPLGAAGVPSDAPHATAVGGTALLNDLNNPGSFLTLGWGNVFALLGTSIPFDPPIAFDFVGGAGGGESTYFPKPSWQAALPGTGRQTPDVSALADPYTGVPILLTVGGSQVILPGIGGTSLASPIFTAFWAIAQQKAGGPLGQAAPLIAALPAGGIQDVLPLTSSTDPVDVITDAQGTKTYGEMQIFSGYTGTNTGFMSAIVNESILPSPIYSYFLDLSFGLDSSLTVTPGWDNVTGYGSPYGLTFINAVAAASTPK